MCFVDIDSNTVEVPEDLPSFPFEQDLKEELVQAIISSKERMLKETSADSVISSPRRKPTKLSSRSTEPVLSKTNSLSRGIDKLEALQHSEAWTKISALAKKTGVWSNTLDDYTEKSPKIVKEVERADPVFQDFNSMPNRELEELKFNNAVREIFLNRFVNMFCWYDEFVMQTTQDMDSWISNRETMHNFDKASFLSDQPENYLPFLSPFLETQMFATFIDNKILSQWEEIDPNLKVFDIRVKTLRDECDANTHRMDSYTPCCKIRDTGEFTLCWNIVHTILPQNALKRDCNGKCIEWIEGHYLEVVVLLYIGLDKQNFPRKFVNIFLPIGFNVCFGCSKEPSL